MQLLWGRPHSKASSDLDEGELSISVWPSIPWEAINSVRDQFCAGGVGLIPVIKTVYLLHPVCCAIKSCGVGLASWLAPLGGVVTSNCCCLWEWFVWNNEVLIRLECLLCTRSFIPALFLISSCYLKILECILHLPGLEWSDLWSQKSKLLAPHL